MLHSKDKYTFQTLIGTVKRNAILEAAIEQT